MVSTFYDLISTAFLSEQILLIFTGNVDLVWNHPNYVIACDPHLQKN